MIAYWPDTKNNVASQAESDFAILRHLETTVNLPTGAVSSSAGISDYTSSSESSRNVLYTYIKVNADSGITAKDIAGANFYNWRTMVSDGTRLWWITPGYGTTIVSCKIGGQNSVELYPDSNRDEAGINGASLKLLTINASNLFFVREGVGLFKMPVDGGDSTKLIEGNIQDYIIKDNMIYFSDFVSDITAVDGFYVLKSYNTDTQQIIEVDQLATGKELLKIGGYIVGFLNDELIYTRRDAEYKRGYYSYSKAGQSKSIPYEEGQKKEIEIAKNNFRPLNLEGSEVSRVEGKSLVMQYNKPGPNILLLADGNNKKKIAEVNGDYSYLFTGQIFVLDREGNIEHIVF